MYQISQYSNKIKNTITGVVFPQDSINENYSNYINWLKEENEPEFVDYIEGEETEYNRQFIPKTVSQRQLRTQLILSGFDLNDIQNAINGMSEPNKSIAQVAWDYAITFERESPLLICIANNLQLTTTEVDNIFLNASKL